SSDAQIIMKFFLAFLLIASCQAFSIESAIEKEAFEILVNKASDELEKLALQEFENVLLGDGKEMSPFEHELITKVANYFGAALRSEIQSIVEKVLDSASAKTAFTKKMYENLRQAALNISEGLHMAPKAAAKFLHDMM
ncbi:hypothetical protein P5E99_15920, partial [Clostridium perfringens]|nr:hypothetical protein [Clostridium perfringens]